MLEDQQNSSVLTERRDCLDVTRVHAPAISASRAVGKSPTAKELRRKMPCPAAGDAAELVF